MGALHEQFKPIATLSKIALGYKVPGTIYRDVIPVIKVDLERDAFADFGQAGFRIVNTKRGLYGDANYITSKEDSQEYKCEDHYLGAMIDIEKEEKPREKIPGAIARLRQQRSYTAHEHHEVALEKNTANLILNSSNYTAGQQVTLTSTDKFTDLDDSTPYDVIVTGKEKARKSMGARANIIVCGLDVYFALLKHPQIKGLLASDERKVVSHQKLEELLELKVIVGERTYVAQDGTVTDIWKNNLAILHKPEGQIGYSNPAPIHSALFEMNGYPKIMEGMMNPFTKSIVEARKYDLRTVGTQNGFLVVGAV